MASKSSAGPFFSSARRETAPISRSQSTSARMRRSSSSFSSSAIHCCMSMKPLLIAALHPPRRSAPAPERLSSAASVRGDDFVQEASELPALVPRAQTQRHVAEPGGGVRAQLLRARLRVAGDRPPLDELRAEIRRVVGVEELLGLLEPGLPVLVDVDVVVERAAEGGRVAAFLLRHRADARELLGELRWAQLVGHPAVGILRDTPVRALDDGLGGARSLLPGEPRRAGGDS